MLLRLDYVQPSRHPRTWRGWSLDAVRQPAIVMRVRQSCARNKGQACVRDASMDREFTMRGNRASHLRTSRDEWSAGAHLTAAWQTRVTRTLNMNACN